MPSYRSSASCYVARSIEYLKATRDVAVLRHTLFQIDRGLIFETLIIAIEFIYYKGNSEVRSRLEMAMANELLKNIFNGNNFGCRAIFLVVDADVDKVHVSTRDKGKPAALERRALSLRGDNISTSNEHRATSQA